MASQALMEKMEMRQHYRNLWHTDILDAPAADPLFCCFSFWCGPCASYLLRKRALYDDMSRYTCCGGYMPCSGKFGESQCPEFCLCTEVFLCFNNSVASTRFMIQDEFNIQTTECDNCIIGFMFCLQQLACICSLIACLIGGDEISEIADLLRCLSDLVYCVVCPCMQTQHKVELDKRDGQHGGPPVMAVPPTQQMSRMDQPIPPPVGYPPPPPYAPQPQGYPPAEGYPAPGYPPYPQAQGYPPAKYPPPPDAYAPPPPGAYGPPPPGAYGPSPPGAYAPPPPGAYPSSAPGAYGNAAPPK